MRFHDIYGGLHIMPREPYPAVEQTENAPLYSGHEIVGKYKEKQLTESDCWNYLDYVYAINKNGTWYPTPISTNKRFSHDNMTGTIGGLLAVIKFARKNKYSHLKEKAKLLFSDIPWFHHKYLHPRDIMYMLRVKIPVLGPILSLLVPITQITMIISCIQSHKLRNGNLILKTDGKLLAWNRLNICFMPITKFICTQILRKKPKFRSFKNCAVMYFKHPEQPLRRLIA